MPIIDDSLPIGLIGHTLRSKNIFNIDLISNEYLQKQNKLKDNGNWNYDSALINGSNSTCDIEVISGALLKKNVSIWSINHYLGLNRNQEVINAGIDALKKYGTGSGTSAMSGGHSDLHKKLQNKFSTIFNKQEAMLYPTGFTANLGAISGLMKGSVKENLIIIDEECHASIIDGCKLSGVRFFRFKHNDIDDLRKKITKYKQTFTNIMVIVESIYSMSGDIAPLIEISELKKQNNFIFYVDESHSFGFYGKNGTGLCNELNISHNVDIIMTTLSKSCASIGGIIATSHQFCSILKWSTSYIYQAAIPPHDVAIILKSLEKIDIGDISQSLKAKTTYLRHKLKISGFDIGDNQTSIIPVYINDHILLKKMEKELINNNIYTVAIQYPIVDISKSRFRFIVNASHTYADLDNLVITLVRIKENITLVV